jgi:hypothetical protein
MTILLTGALLLLLVGSLSAVQTPSSLMRMSDLANQSGALTPSENNAEDYLSESTAPMSIRSGGNYDFNSKISHKLKIDGGRYASDADHIPIPSSVPEPTTLILIGLGLAGAGILRRKK